MAGTKKTASEPVPDHQNDSDTPTYYVALGASAGGLEALEGFFKNMPADSGMAFIIIQHLSPSHKSMMAELMARHTDMPVRVAQNNMRVEANSIYLIPPNRNLGIFHGALLLLEQEHNRGLNLPIDLFFKALAEDQGEKAIAIVLSGTGSDGSRGVRSIKENLGMVMVQDAETAKFDSMPKSAIATGLVDFVLEVEEMPKQLRSFLEHPYTKENRHALALMPGEDNMTRIFFMLKERHGVDFTFYKPSTLIRRIERRMLLNQIETLDDYVAFLGNNLSENDALYHELLIGVTSFFRDPTFFEALFEQALSMVFARDNSHEVRVWVVGCSTGEEAYTIAMLLREYMEQNGINKDVKIFATDVDRDAILKAGNGHYPETIAADVPEPYLQKYFFHNDDNHYQVSRKLREMIVFAQHNLLKDPPFTNIDMVCCRNLLIYFQPVLQKKVMELFNFSLRPNGVLFLGASETTGEMSSFFEALYHKEKIYRSRGKRNGGSLITDPVHGVKVKDSEAWHPAYTPRRYQLHEEERMLERLLQGVAGDYVPLAVVVNEDHEMLYTLGDTQAFFRVPTGKMVNVITKLVIPELVIPISTGMQKCFSKNESVTYTSIRIPGRENSITMRIKPLPRRKGQQALTALFFEDEQKAPAMPNEDEVYDVSEQAQQRIHDLEQALQFHRENLQATVEELETSNEELQATNEELMASNEELQSTNEELHSVNEELYTVNAEYQAKIVELTELNNDLENLYQATQVATIFLDENLDIRKFTPTASQLINIIENDIGRPFVHLKHQLVNVNLHQLIQQVQSGSTLFDAEVQSLDERWFLMRIMPYIVAPSVASGVVITFTDISQLKHTKDALNYSETRNAMALKMTGMGSWAWNVRDDKLSWSDTLEPLFGLEPEAFDGTLEAFIAHIHPDDRERVRNGLNGCIERGEEYHVEHRIVLPNGNIRWVREIGDAIRGDSGEALQIFGIIKDISTEKTEQSELARTQARLRLLLDTMTDGEITIDQTGKVIDINPAAERMFGYPVDEVVGENVKLLMPAADAKAHDGHIRRYLKSGKSAVLGKGRQLRGKRKDGSEFDFDLAFTQIVVDEEIQFTGVLRHIESEHQP